MSSPLRPSTSARNATGSPKRRGGTAPRLTAQRREQLLEAGRKQLIAQELKTFKKFFPNCGKGMVTGKGQVIGKDAPLLKFIPSTEYEGRNYDFVAVLDHINPIGCDDPVDERHYLIQWLVDGQPETSWTHCTNIDDHLSGLQEFYDDVTKTRVAAAVKDYEEKLAKKDRMIARRDAKIEKLTKERDEARAELARAGSPQPTAEDFGANGRISAASERTNELFDDAGGRTQSLMPQPRSGALSAAAKRVLSPSWALPSGSNKQPRMASDFPTEGFVSDVRTGSRLANAFDFEQAYQFGSQAPSRASSRASSASQPGRVKSLPDWIDTTGWGTKRVNATTRAYRGLRVANLDLTEKEFKAKVLATVAAMEKAGEE